METVNGMNLKEVLESIQNCTQPCNGHTDHPSIDDCWKEVFETVEKIDVLQKAFALACRLLSDNDNCPAEDGAKFPECNGEMDECGSESLWKCWQRYFTEKAQTEGVCKLCGCTWNNACSGGCSWVEPDLCSSCI